MFYFSKFSFLIFLFSLFAGFYFSSYAVSNIQVCGVRQINTVFDYTNNDYLSSDNCNSLRMLYAVGDTNTKATVTNYSTIDMQGLTTANSVGIYGGANSNIINQGKITNVTSSANNSNVSGMYLVGVGSTALNDTTGEIICNTEFSTFGILGTGGSITNNGNITGCSRGLYIRDIGATAVNNGVITCLNGTGIGMYAINGATATNKGTIKDCATGMVSNGIGSNAINDSSIACYNTTGKGMQSLNGGTITNNGSIVGCSVSANSGNIDNGSINDGTIGSPTKPILTGLYVCGVDTGLLSYTNKEGNTLDCASQSIISATNSNTSAVNNGIINVIAGSYGMLASNGGSVINNNYINVTNGIAIYTNGINSKAINSENGKIICNSSKENTGMTANGGSLSENNGLIQNCANGMFANFGNNGSNRSISINSITGIILCDMGNSVGMYASGGVSENYGLIQNCYMGMRVSSSSSINGKTGKIICNGAGYGIYGDKSKNYGLIKNCENGMSGYSINAETGVIICDLQNTNNGMYNNFGGSVENYGLIQNCGKGINVNNEYYSIINGKSGAIICNTGGMGMYVYNNLYFNNSMENHGLINNCGVGMYSDGSNSINSKTGKIICENSKGIGMKASGMSIATNEGLIENCYIGMLADGGYYHVASTVINASTGVIRCANSSGIGMQALAGTTATNHGLIENCSIGMVDDTYYYNGYSKTNNSTTGVIKCINGNGMRIVGGTLTNSGLIQNCTTGISTDNSNIFSGLITTATNSTTGKISCNSGSGIGMEAKNGSIVTNEGLIENCAIGIVSDGTDYNGVNIYSTAINASTGVIKCYDSSGIGMKSINGGIIKNEGTIIGCSDSVSVASSDEPSISLAIAMADNETIPSTPSTGSNPRGALSYDIGAGMTASYINSGLTNQSMGGSFVEVTGSGTLAIKNSGTILCGSGLEECFGMNGTHNTTYEASVGAGNTMGSVIVLDDSTINIPQTSIIGGAIPDKEYTYKDVFVSSGGGSITGADNITSGSIVWNVTPVANDHSVDVIVTKNSYTDLASAEHSAIAKVLEANYNGSNLYQSLNQKDIKSFNSALNQLSGADLSGGRGANLDSMSLINKADSGFNSRQDFISSYEGSYEKQSSFASNVGDITMGETQNQLTDNVTVRSVMAISQVSNNPLYNTYSYRYAGRVGLGKNYGFYTNTQLLQASSYNARTMDLGSGVSTLGRIENVTAIISDNYAYVSAKASDNVTLLAYSGASTSYSIFSNSTEQASNTDMQFAALNLGGYNQTVVSAVIGQEIAYKSKTNGTLSLMAKVSTPIMSVGNERTASFSTGESFIVNTGAEIGVYTATLGMNYLLGDTATKGFNAKVSAYREINSIEINDNAYATLGYAF